MVRPSLSLQRSVLANGLELTERLVSTRTIRFSEISTRSVPEEKSDDDDDNLSTQNVTETPVPSRTIRFRGTSTWFLQEVERDDDDENLPTQNVSQLPVPSRTIRVSGTRIWPLREVKSTNNVENPPIWNVPRRTGDFQLRIGSICTMLPIKQLPILGHVEDACGLSNIKHIPNTFDIHMRKKYNNDADRSNFISEVKKRSHFGRRGPVRWEEKLLLMRQQLQESTLVNCAHLLSRTAQSGRYQ